jgi:hypothetical protein
MEAHLRPLSQDELEQLIERAKLSGDRRLLEGIRRMIAEVKDLRAHRALSQYAYDIEETL